MTVPLTPTAIRAVLAERGLRPRRRHGQNFLADARIRDAVVAAAGVERGDLVLEVGPGLGALTAGLLDAGAEVVAAELDAGLCAFLAEAFRGESRLTLLRGDALGRRELAAPVRAAIEARRRPDRRFLLVSNLPYSAGTPLLAALATDPDPPAGFTVMVQKEVALRMTGRPGDPDYGPLAVVLALRGEGRIVREVPGGVFVPRTAVRSAVVSFVLRPAERRRILAGDRAAREAFLHRRKGIRKSLLLAGHPREAVLEALGAAGVDPGDRPEVIAPESFVEIGLSLRGRRFDDGGPSG